MNRAWPFRRKPRTPPPQASAEAKEALRQAKRQLVDAERLDSHAKDVAARLEQIRQINGFGAAVIRSMRGT